MKGFTRAATAATALLLAATPALAGKHDRAETAIAQAQAKIDASGKVVGADMPRMQANAEAALRSAREALKSGHKEEAIAEANRAQQLADQALGESQKRQADAAQAQSDASVAAATAAAADANARADAATQAAVAAQADAQAARSAPPVMVAPAPTPTQTTTTTTEVTHPASRRVVRTPKTTVRKTTTTTASGQ